MSKSTIISFALCAVGSVGLFAWMFSSEPLQPVAGVRPINSAVKTVKNKQKGPEVFAIPRNKATALNDLPVNIVIDSGAGTIPVHTGSADLVVTSSGLRMRSEPTSRSNTLGNYSKGARFSHIRDEDGWALVQSLEDGQKGWMFKKYMAKEG